MNVRNETIDLGALLGRGHMPFSVVEETIQNLRVNEVVHFAVPFEPTPLYPHIKSWGARYKVEKTMEGVLLTVTKEAEGETIPEYLDLRRLLPPEPFTKTIEAFEKLSPGQCLIAHWPHRPVPLLTQLDAMGVNWEEHPQEDGSCQIYLLKRGPEKR